MIKIITKIITSMLLYSSLFLLSANIYAADAPHADVSPPSSQDNEDTSKYLGILLNYTFGLDQDDNNIPKIHDPDRDEGNSKNLLSGLIFLNPADRNNVFANAAANPPWWYDPNLDILPAQDNTSNRNNSPSYPANPTIQAMTNSLSSAYEVDCIPTNNTSNQSGCTPSNYQQNIMDLIIDGSGNIDQNKINQLSVSSLLDPLQYGNDGNATSQQEQQDAMNFIRLTSAAMLDITLDPEYENILDDAQYGTTTEIKENAQKALTDYNSKIIGYASRSSVVMDNLYYLLSRRMANPDTQKSINQTEYDMVESRIDPAGQWKSNLKDQPLSTTMQDIAELLAEQQYQSYLRGQENERLIATLSTLVIAQQEFLKMNYYIDTDE